MIERLGRHSRVHSVSADAKSWCRSSTDASVSADLRERVGVVSAATGDHRDNLTLNIGTRQSTSGDRSVAAANEVTNYIVVEQSPPLPQQRCRRDDAEQTLTSRTRTPSRAAPPDEATSAAGVCGCSGELRSIDPPPPIQARRWKSR